MLISLEKGNISWAVFSVCLFSAWVIKRLINKSLFYLVNLTLGSENAI